MNIERNAREGTDEDGQKLSNMLFKCGHGEWKGSVG